MTDNTQQETTVYIGLTDREQEELRWQRVMESREESRHQRLDESIPGGAYLVGGQVVNADGVPITHKSLEEIEAEVAAARKAAGPRENV